MKNILDRFMEKVEKTDGCWIWNAFKDHGYGKFEHEGEMMLSHRVAYELFIGKIPPGMDVCHKCDNPSCVNPEHLFIGTTADNMRDCKNKGRIIYFKGEKHPRARLSRKDVNEIKKSYDTGIPTIELAKIYGVSRRHIYSIINGDRWKD